MTQAASPAPAGKYAEQIARGAAFLDEKASGWRQRVDLDRLQMSDCTACVLGQLDGRGSRFWYSMLTRFGLNPEVGEDVEHGFATSEDDGDTYEQLTTEWRQYIEATR
jgi:hypothetical protein